MNKEQLAKLERAFNLALTRFTSTLTKTLGYSTAKPTQEKSTDVARLLEQLEELLKDGARASKLTEAELDRLVRESELIALTSSAFLARRPNNGSGGPAESCTFACKRERDACISGDCPGDTSCPCGCCVACNATWMACLADCVLGVASGSGNVIIQ